MKVLLNTSLDHHFIALEKNQGIIDSHTWTNKRKDGREIWNFLQKHQKDLPLIKEVNALSGPGGFTSLRVSSTIIKSLQIINPTLKIKSITGEKYGHFLAKNFPEKKFDYYLLNSFGDKIFVIQHPVETNNNLSQQNPIPITEAQKILQNKTYWSETLPEQKQQILAQNKSPLESSDLGGDLEGGKKLFTPALLSQACQEKNPTDFFLPEYYFPAVQN